MQAPSTASVKVDFLVKAPPEITKSVAARIASIAVPSASVVAVTPMTRASTKSATNCVAMAKTGISDAAPISTREPSAQRLPKSISE